MRRPLPPITGLPYRGGPSTLAPPQRSCPRRKKGAGPLSSVLGMAVLLGEAPLQTGPTRRDWLLLLSLSAAFARWLWLCIGVAGCDGACEGGSDDGSMVLVMSDVLVDRVVLLASVGADRDRFRPIPRPVGGSTNGCE
jgi:hypothetical protein